MIVLLTWVKIKSRQTRSSRLGRKMLQLGSSNGRKTTPRVPPTSLKHVSPYPFSEVISAGRELQEGTRHSQGTHHLQRQATWVNQRWCSNWAVARNYEEMLDIYVTQFPDTPLETLKQTAKTGFHYFRMAESVDKGIAMLSRIAKYNIPHLACSWRRVIWNKEFKSSSQHMNAPYRTRRALRRKTFSPRSSKPTWKQRYIHRWKRYIRI